MTAAVDHAETIAIGSNLHDDANEDEDEDEEDEELYSENALVAQDATKQQNVEELMTAEGDGWTDEDDSHVHDTDGGKMTKTTTGADGGDV